MPSAPESVYYRVEEQFQNAGGNDAADHRRGDSLHHVGSALCGRRPHDGKQPKKNSADCHDLRADALDGPFNDRALQVGLRVHAARGAKSVPGLVEIQQHHDASFRVKPGQRDKADPYGHAHVVAEQIEKPERAHQREGHGKKHDTRFHHAPGIQIDEQQNDEQREGDDDFEPLLRALEILELPGPLNVEARRKLHRVMDALRRGLYVAFDITTCDVYKDEADELAVLIADKRRTGLVGNIGEHGDRYLRQRWAGRRLYRAPRTSGCERHRGCLRCARRQRHEHALERVKVITEVARVADVDWVTLAPFDGRGDGLAARGTLGEYTASVWKAAQQFLNLHADVLDCRKVRTEDFDAENRTETGVEHFGACLDRHPEDVCHPGRFEFLVHLGEQSFPRHTGTPLALRLKFYHRLDHRKRRRVGGRLRLARLAEDVLDFRKFPEHAVLDLQNLTGLVNRDTGHRRWHKKYVALV